MTRGISSTNLTAVQQPSVVAVIFIELDLLKIAGSIQEFVRFCSARNALLIGGDTFSAVGEFLSIGSVTENTDLTANKFSIELSGVSADNIATIKDFRYQGRSAKMWLGFLDRETGLLKDVPERLYEGRIDNMPLSIGVSGTIIVNVEDKLLRAYNPTNRKYTKQDQIVRFAGDNGLDFIPSLVDKKINWGLAGQMSEDLLVRPLDQFGGGGVSRSA